MKLRRPWDVPEFAKFYCAATVTAVAAVAAAGTAAYSSYSQSKNAKNAAGALANDPAGAYGTKVKPVKYKDNVNLPNYDPMAGVSDYARMLPMLNSISQSVTKQGMINRDSISGGQASANLNQEGADINGLLKGDVPSDVKDNIMRQVASRTGGAFSPGGAANQAGQTEFARNLGLTSTQMMQQGMSAAPTWESLVDAFTYKPQQAFGDAMTALQSRDSYQLNAANLQLKRDENNYTGEVNYEKMKSMPNPQLMGMTNDQLQLGNVQNQDNTNTINALLGALKGGVGVYNSLGGGSGGSSAAGGDIYGSSGYIPSSNLGAAYSSYATPGYTPNFSNSPGGYYFSGYTAS
jgi:hypothetical protein